MTTNSVVRSRTLVQTPALTGIASSVETPLRYYTSNSSHKIVKADPVGSRSQCFDVKRNITSTSWQGTVRTWMFTLTLRLKLNTDSESESADATERVFNLNKLLLRISHSAESKSLLLLTQVLCWRINPKNDPFLQDDFASNFGRPGLNTFVSPHRHDSIAEGPPIRHFGRAPLAPCGPCLLLLALISLCTKYQSALDDGQRHATTPASTKACRPFRPCAFRTIRGGAGVSEEEIR